MAGRTSSDERRGELVRWRQPCGMSPGRQAARWNQPRPRQAGRIHTSGSEGGESMRAGASGASRGAIGRSKHTAQSGRFISLSTYFSLV
jgi:hypothetical protein